jgi:hypothetical protein
VSTRRGATPEAAAAGIGRFARPRSGLPNRLN